MPSGETVTSYGALPAGVGAPETVRVVRSMTKRLLLPKQLTSAVVPSEVMPTRDGVEPTEIGAPTRVRVGTSMTDTLSLRRSVVSAVMPSGVIATPNGSPPTGMTASTVRVARSRTETDPPWCVMKAVAPSGVTATSRGVAASTMVSSTMLAAAAEAPSGMIPAPGQPHLRPGAPARLASDGEGWRRGRVREARVRSSGDRAAWSPGFPSEAALRPSGARPRLRHREVPAVGATHPSSGCRERARRA